MNLVAGIHVTFGKQFSLSKGVSALQSGFNDALTLHLDQTDSSRRARPH